VEIGSSVWPDFGPYGPWRDYVGAGPLGPSRPGTALPLCPQQTLGISPGVMRLSKQHNPCQSLERAGTARPGTCEPQGLASHSASHTGHAGPGGRRVRPGSVTAWAGEIWRMSCSQSESACLIPRERLLCFAHSKACTTPFRRERTNHPAQSMPRPREPRNEAPSLL